MHFKQRKQKGVLDAFRIGIGAILMFAIIGLLATFSANIVQTNQNGFAAGTVAWSVSNGTLTGFWNIGQQLGTLGSLTIFLIILLALVGVVGYLAFR